MTPYWLARMTSCNVKEERVVITRERQIKVTFAEWENSENKSWGTAICFDHYQLFTEVEVNS